MIKHKNILLSTLGTSPMIVPQAFLTEGTSFDEVHVFTTDNERAKELYKVLNEFFEARETKFTLTVALGVQLPNTTELNNQFAESLYQWYVEKSGTVLPYVCLSGGTKTIPTIMQKAAQLFGAREVFHVISNKDIGSDPTNISEIQKALEKKQIQIIRFGAETGWIFFRQLVKSSRHSESLSIEGSFYKKKKPQNYTLLNEIGGIQEEIKAYFEQGKQGLLPFPGLLPLPGHVRSWLNQPLQQEDRIWLHELPKVELHCHLGGFATQPPLLDEARKNAQYPDKLKPEKEINLPPGWPSPENPIPLNDYMRLGDNNGSTILSDPGCLNKQIELLYTSFQKENIKYAEVRCSPFNYTKFQTGLEVLSQIISNFQQLMDTSNEQGHCHVNIIIIATRKDEGDLSSISKHLALAITTASDSNKKENKCRVVGVDLAGFETKQTRASYFQQDFVGIHRCGLAVTAHAGENDDAEGIWQAVFQLNARRIGHALHLHQANDLMRTFADRQIGIEMCPFSNYQIKGFYPMRGKEDENYPLLQYLKAGIPVTVNTDNIGISSASLTDNYLLLGKMLPEVTRMEVLQLIRNSIQVAFISEQEKDNLLLKFDHEIFKRCMEVF